MNLLPALRAELAKHSRRPAAWATALLPLVGFVAMWYYGQYQTFQEVAAERIQFHREPGEILTGILPEAAVATTAGLVPFGGAAVAIILAALVVGTEYGTDTIKVSLTQGPSRGEFLAAKATVLLLWMLSALTAAFATAAGVSHLVASAEGATSSLPPLAEAAAGVGYGLAGMAAWAAVATLLAVWTRNTGLTIAALLVYLVAVEGLVEEFAANSRVVGAVQAYLLTPNVRSVMPTAEGYLLPTGAEIGIARGLLVLAAYAAVAIAASAVVLRRRDVT